MKSVRTIGVDNPIIWQYDPSGSGQSDHNLLDS